MVNSDLQAIYMKNVAQKHGIVNSGSKALDMIDDGSNTRHDQFSYI